jgi:hypothetical protein
VVTEVEAGVVLDPQVRATNRAPVGAASKPLEAAPVAPIAAAAAPAGRELRAETVPAPDSPAVAPTASGPEPVSPSNLPVDDGGGDTVLLAVGGGILLVLILLLLARRK